MSTHLYRPSSLLKFLNEESIYPKKRLSQNFLIDGNIIQKIIDAADVQAGDLIIEIGPGPGALTEALLNKQAQVIVIEKDLHFAKKLQRLDPQGSLLTIYHQDFLKFPITEHLSSKKKAKVISNLPYHLTSPIISKLIPLNDRISTLTLMMQKEVSDVCVAPVNSKSYSSFTLFLQYYSTPKYLFPVNPGCFLPKPQVRSAMVQFTLKPTPAYSNPSHFFKTTRTAFQHRRKMLRASIKSLYSVDSIQKNLIKIGSHSMARPQELSLDQFLNLVRLSNEENTS